MELEQKLCTKLRCAIILLRIFVNKENVGECIPFHLISKALAGVAFF